MWSKVADFIERRGLLSREGLHLVALSGGADSVALLRVLLRLGYRVEAVHCNFHLRGEESLRDEAFVRKLCEREIVPLHLIHFDTKTYADLHQVSIEMAARELRYRYFERLREDIGAATVCVAHHQDDAVETLLMNLLRGAGIHGLTGIRPRNGHIVRPLLCVSRHQIEQYLCDIGQDYVTDSTNFEADVLRNKLRLQVIPQLREIAPAASENIARSAWYLAEAERVYRHAIPSCDVDSLPLARLRDFPSPLCLLHEWLAPRGFNRIQIETIAASLDAGPGREFRSHSHSLFIDRTALFLEPIAQPMKPLKIPEEGRYRLSDGTAIDISLSNDVSISKSSDCATLDAALVEFPLTLRTVREGDRFQPFGMKGQKLLSDFMTDRKLSLHEKRCQKVVTDASGTIVWVVGLRTDHRFRVSEATRAVLQLAILPDFE